MFSRFVAFWLTHFCRSITLCKIERAILKEVLSRQKHAIDGNPSPAQWLAHLPRWFIRWRIKRAENSLWNRLGVRPVTPEERAKRLAKEAAKAAAKEAAEEADKEAAKEAAKAPAA
jgi:hypothetical protein